MLGSVSPAAAWSHSGFAHHLKQMQTPTPFISIVLNRADPFVAVGCDHHSDCLPAAVGPGGACGDAESEAATVCRGRGGRQDEASVHGVRWRAPIKGTSVACSPSGAENENQQRKREGQLEEKEESKGIRKEEEEGTTGGGCQSDAVRITAV